MLATYQLALLLSNKDSIESSIRLTALSSIVAVPLNRYLGGRVETRPTRIC